MPKQLAIILVNWNSFDLTRDTLCSLQKTNFKNYDCVLVDNGSADASAQKLQQAFPEIILISLNENKGFTGGNNAGMQYALEHGYEYIMMLNNDVEVDADFLEPLMAPLNNDPSIGAVQPLIYFHHDKNLIWNAGTQYNPWLGICSTIHYNKRDDAHAQMQVPKNIDWITGCAFMIRATVLQKVGLLQEKYFIYYEDVDLSFRIKAAGFKLAYARNAQNIHLVSNATTSSPTDVILGSTINTKPEIADQAAFGWFKNFKENSYEFNAEIYYKYLQNQIDYRNGANTQANQVLEGELLYGLGRAYGLEMILKKKKGKFNGWISYCLSKSERKIEGINNGAWYNAKQDRTHDVSVVTIYDLTPKLSISALFVFYTGNAVTFPSGKYTIEGQTQFLYTTRNGARMPNYHRLDLGVNWIRKNTDTYESSWNFSIYNVYGRENAYTIAFREKEGNPNITEAVQTSLFRWIPAITYNFKFK